MIWIKTSPGEYVKAFLAMKKTSVRHCPICRMAMVASKSREDLEKPDTYCCLSCGTEVVETPRQGGEKGNQSSR